MEYATYLQGFESQRQTWPVDPLQVIVETLKERKDGLKIADVGCGSAMLSRKVSNVISYDKFSKGDNIINCDMSKVINKDLFFGCSL